MSRAVSLILDNFFILFPAVSPAGRISVDLSHEGLCSLTIAFAGHASAKAT